MNPFSPVIEVYLPAGTIVKVDGIPVELVSSTKIRTFSSNLDLIEDSQTRLRCGCDREVSLLFPVE